MMVDKPGLKIIKNYKPHLAIQIEGKTKVEGIRDVDEKACR